MLKKLFLAALFLVSSLCFALQNNPLQVLPSAQESNVQYSKVITVFDGDTIEIEGGKRVRYIGIDAPDREHPLYIAAKKKNEELVLHKTIKLEICKAESRDIHGRTLAFAYADDIMVNAELLKLGYARILIIHPCGTKKETEFHQLQKEAMQKRLGIWKKREKVHITSDFISASDASKFVNERKAVYGKVLDMRRSKNAIFMDLGDNGKVRMNLVIFSENQKYFEDFGINFEKEYSGKKVVVYGHIKLYKDFPEIILSSPSQIEVWE